MFFAPLEDEASHSPSKAEPAEPTKTREGLNGISMASQWHLGSGNHSLHSLHKACPIFHDISEAMNLRQIGCESDPFCPAFRFPMTSGHGMRLAS